MGRLNGNPGPSAVGQAARNLSLPDDADGLPRRVADYVRGPLFDPPPLPRVAQEVWSACAMGEASALQVAHIVHRDPIVAGRVLALANSARFGSADPVQTLRDAIVRIGFEELLNAVLMISLKSALYSLKLLSELGENSRRHGVATAIAASRIAEATGCAPSPRAFLAGLMHDVGEPLVLHVVERLQHVTRGDPVPEEAAVRRIARDLHSEVGTLVADRWQLDLELRVVISKHHEDRPLADCGPLLRLVRVADSVSAGAGIGLEREPGEDDEGEDDDPADSLPEDAPGMPLSLLERIRDELPERLAEYDDL